MVGGCGELEFGLRVECITVGIGGESGRGGREAEAETSGRHLGTETRWLGRVVADWLTGGLADWRTLAGLGWAGGGTRRRHTGQVPGRCEEEKKKSKTFNGALRVKKERTARGEAAANGRTAVKRHTKGRRGDLGKGGRSGRRYAIVVIRDG